MQQIERYGVIALVFLLVTIVAVSFWGDSKSPGFWSRLTGKGKKEEVAKVETPAVTSEQALQGGAPLNPAAPVAPLGGQPGAVGAQGETLGGAALPGAQPDASALAGGQPAPGAVPSAPAPQGGSVAPGTNAGGAPGSNLALTPPAPVVDPAPAAREYTVQKGDSLALIARRTLGSEQRWSELQTLNPGVTPKSLKVGMKLKLPEGASVAAATTKPAAGDAAPSGKSAVKPSAKVASAAAPAAKKSESKGGARYTIQRGDTLTAIAERKLGSKARVKDILALNPGLDPKRLSVGKSIQLPAGAAVEKAPLVATAVSSSREPGRPRVR